jgi:hypothetical protein
MEQPFRKLSLQTQQILVEQAGIAQEMSNVRLLAVIGLSIFSGVCVLLIIGLAVVLSRERKTNIICQRELLVELDHERDDHDSMVLHETQQRISEREQKVRMDEVDVKARAVYNAALLQQHQQTTQQAKRIWSHIVDYMDKADPSIVRERIRDREVEDYIASGSVPQALLKQAITH